jgi:orotidine-5'-phosphate decarboxylase
MAQSSIAVIDRPNRVDARNHLIVALDVPSIERASALVSQLGEEVSYYKVGPHLFVKGLITFIEDELIAKGKRVFLDFKSVDIGDTMRGMAAHVAQLGVEFITVMGAAATIKAAREGRNGSCIPKILAVTLLTDHNEADMQREYGTKATLTDFVIERALGAARAGADGVISSPREVAALRKAFHDSKVRDDFLIVTPGVRPAGVSADDQKRIATPSEAISAGADFLVIGRPIIRSSDNNPLRAARRILDEMQTALEQR